MALLWADSFDHYGTSPNGGRDNMLLGAWAAFGGSSGTLPIIVSTQKRTGTYSLQLLANNSGIFTASARRTLGKSCTVVGVGFGIFLSNLPAVNRQFRLTLNSVTNAVICNLYINSTGSIEISNSAETTLAVSDPIISAGSFQHIELKTIIDNVVGVMEVRVDGVTVINATNLNLGATPAAQLSLFNIDGNNLTVYIDDIFAWDDSGSYNNTFLGQQRIQTVFPDADTAVADWALTGAVSGYQCINQAAPDGDTTYIQASAVGHKSDFELPALAPETSSIAAVYVPVMAKLAAAGAGSIETSLMSGGIKAAGGSKALSTGYTYNGSVFPVDPNTGAAWTKAGLEAARVRVEKTA